MVGAKRGYFSFWGRSKASEPENHDNFPGASAKMPEMSICVGPILGRDCFYFRFYYVYFSIEFLRYICEKALCANNTYFSVGGGMCDVIGDYVRSHTTRLSLPMRLSAIRPSKTVRKISGHQNIDSSSLTKNNSGQSGERAC